MRRAFSHRIAAFTLLFLFSAINSGLGEDAPELVIDSQGHSGLVKKLLFTPDGKELISLGFDKSIRIWDVANGSLKRTIRTQIGDGDVGKHYAGDLSPDGRYLAVGGWAAKDSNQVGWGRIIDLKSDKLVAVLEGHADTIGDLTFSSDGKTLFTASSDDTVKVWDLTEMEGGADVAIHISAAQTLSPKAGDMGSVGISKSGRRLVGGAFNGAVIVWERPNAISSFKESKRLKGHAASVDQIEITSDGETVFSAGRKGMLNRWDAGSGKKIFELSLKRQIGTMSLSPDESKLLASSKTSNEGTTLIVDAATGKALYEFEGHNNSVFASAWHPTDTLVATSGGDTFETLLWRSGDGGGKERGETVHQLVGKGLNVYNVGCSLDASSTEVALGFIAPADHWLANAPLQMVFDFGKRSLRPLKSAEDANSFLTLNWESGKETLEFTDAGGIKIPGRGTIVNSRNTSDRFRTATISHDGKSVIGGSSYYLARYSDSSGSFKQVADYVGHFGGINAVSTSADGKYLVSGSTDQTARIWNLETGALLASFFASPDGEWVCWTPDGYFDASPEGGNFIGWHFNRGPDKLAEFISGDQLYDHFFRPDIVEKVIAENRPASEIVKELGIVFDLGKALVNTPGVAIVEPSGNMTSPQRRLGLKVQAIDLGGGIGELRVFHEGKRLQPDGPGSFRDGKYEVPFTVSLISGKNEIRAVAANPEGVESKPEVIAVEFSGNKASANLHLLAVGLNEYKNKKFNLNYCRPDVDAFADSFRKGSGKLFADIVVHKLYDADATSEGITEKLKEIAGIATADDVFVFAFAGHGVMSGGDGGKDPEFHIIPYDVTQMYGNDEMLAERALSGSLLQQLAASIPARKQLMVLDACQSGGVVESFAVRGAAEERALAQLARSAGMYVLASTRSEQFAAETDELGHGLFTFALLEALEGKGDANQDGKITVKEVEAWLNERVPELSEKHTGAAQYPNSFARGQDFPIGVTE